MKTLEDLIADAIRNHIATGRPWQQQAYGVRTAGGQWDADPDTEGSCLMGMALLGTPCLEDVDIPVRDIELRYDVCAWCVADAFDDRRLIHSTHREQYYRVVDFRESLALND